MFLYNIFTLYERTKLQTWIIPLLDFLRFACLLDPIPFVIGDGSEIIHRLYLSSQLTVWSYIPSRYRRRRASSYFPIPIFKLIEHFLQQTNKVIYAKFRYPKLVSTICCYIRKLAVLFYEDNLIFFSLTVDSSNMELVLHQIYIPE